MRPLACWLLIGTALLGAPTYLESIHAWQEHRNTGLRNPSGWLTLVGLFWLTPDKAQTVGSATNADFPLPKSSAPEHVGTLLLHGGKITFTQSTGAGVQVDGHAAKGPATLSFDEEKPTTVQAGSVSFVVIKRGDQYAVRVRDARSPVLEHFTGMKFFPVDPKWRVQAKLVKDPKKIPILNVLGKTDQEESPGYVEFVQDGKSYRLRPIFEGDTLFFLFKDFTNKKETYQLGRMLNTPLPKGDTVDLDFNRAYNPPCTFTNYATCPLPPRENNLGMAVPAGELRYGKGHPEAGS